MDKARAKPAWGLWAAAAAGVGLLAAFWPVVLQLLLQVLTGYGIMGLALPICRRYERRLSPGLSATLALCTLWGIAAGALLGGIPLLARQGRQLAEMLPALWEEVSAWWDGLAAWLAQRGLTLKGVDTSPVENWLSAAGPGLVKRVGTLAGSLGRLLLAPVFAFYFLKDREAITRALCLWVPLGRRSKTVSAAREMKREIVAFFRGQVLISLAVGGLTAIGLALVGIPAWFVMGLMMGILEFVPYLGPILATLPIILFSLPLGLSKTLWALGVVIVVQQLEGSLLSPHLMAGATRLHPAVVLLAISAGGMTGGVWGMVLSLPLVVSLRGIVRVLRLRS